MTPTASRGARRLRPSTFTRISSCRRPPKLAQPHVDMNRIPLAYFADAATREVNAQQEKDVAR